MAIRSNFESLGKQYPMIHDLDLSFCSAIADEKMDCIAASLPNLTHLNLRFSWCSLKGLQSLAKNCDLLSSLNLSNSRVGDNELLLIAKNFSILRKLDLTDSCNHFATGSVTDESVVVLAQKCLFLTHFSVPFSRITDRSLEALGNHSKQLQYLYHCACPYLTEEGLTHLRQVLPRVETSDDVTEFDKEKF